MAIARLKECVNRRIRRCRKVMAERDVDVLIVQAPVDVRYLTGFSGDDSVLVVTSNRKVLVTDSRYDQQIRQECPGLSIYLRRDTMANAVAAVLERLGRSGQKHKRKTAKKKVSSLRIGIESESIAVDEYQRYRKAIGRDLKSVANIVQLLRLHKDECEIAQIRQAVRVAEQAMAEVLDWIEPGFSEQEVAAYLNYQMARRCGGPPAFDTIVAYGGHGAQPHARPGKNRLRSSHTLLFDWGASVNGYRSDLTRCYVTGRIPPVFAEAYQRVLEAQLAAIEEIRPGVAIKQVDQVARNVLKKSKLPVYGHGTGHGIGLDIHEAPALYGRSEAVLEEGMIVTIEPAVYVPGKFGIRIEDDVLVTANGKKVLSRLDKTLKVIG